MLDVSGNPIIGIIFFIGLFIASINYISERDLFYAKLMLVFVSYAQGLLLANIFYSDTIFNLFTAAILFGIFYYLAMSRLSTLFIFVIQRLFKKIQSYPNTELRNEIAMLWQIPAEKIQISIYPGEKSDNAFRKFSFRYVDIYIGELFLKKVNKDELLFTLSHEVAHTKTIRYFLYPIIFPALYWIICLFIIAIMIASGFFNVPAFFILSVILFIIGIMIVNYFSWLNEYKADELGLIKSKMLEGAISLFRKFSERHKNYGVLLNLIFYDHPNPEYRIDKLEKINL